MPILDSIHRGICQVDGPAANGFFDLISDPANINRRFRN
jgi:hypothetical protein